MKRIIFILLILCSISYGQDRDIRYNLDFVKFEMSMDSANTNLSYAYHDVEFLSKAGVTNTTDSTGTASFKSSGYYCITVKPDTSRLSGCTVGDTDSLHIYIKELDCDGNPVSNDSTILTPANIGLNYDMEKIYLYEFSLIGCGSGYRVYARRQDDAGAQLIEVWARR